MCDERAAETETANQIIDESIRAVWHDVRSNLAHEDGLINTRLGWMLAFNGFLFAAFGLLLPTSEMECTWWALSCQVELVNKFEEIRVLLALLGVGVSLAAGVGIWAAYCAILSLNRSYLELIAGKGRPKSVKNFGFYEWPISKGRTVGLGMFSGMSFPILSFGVWLLLSLQEGLALSFGHSAILAIVFTLLPTTYSVVTLKRLYGTANHTNKNDEGGQ